MLISDLAFLVDVCLKDLLDFYGWGKLVSLRELQLTYFGSHKHLNIFFDKLSFSQERILRRELSLSLGLDLRSRRDSLLCLGWLLFLYLSLLFLFRLRAFLPLRLILEGFWSYFHWFWLFLSSRCLIRSLSWCRGLFLMTLLWEKPPFAFRRWRLLRLAFTSPLLLIVSTTLSWGRKVSCRHHRQMTAIIMEKVRFKHRHLSVLLGEQLRLSPLNECTQDHIEIHGQCYIL